MPISLPYYLNGPSLGSSTAVFMDANLTICAPDGFYSDGVIVRQQSGCVLLPQQSCPSCASDCAVTPFSVNTAGVFEVSVNMGAATGAIPITFNPFSSPVGIYIQYNSIVYNIFSSPVYGIQQGTPGFPVYLGDPVTSGCDLVGISPTVLNKYYFDGSAFVSAGTTESITVTAPEITGDDSPGDCVIVIPKTVASPSIVDIKVIAACESPSFNLSVQCPYLLREFSSSERAEDSVVVCGSIVNQTYHVEHVTGIDFELGLYDWVFSDAYGEFPLTKGYYKSPNCPAGYNVFEVDRGIIIGFYFCP